MSEPVVSDYRLAPRVVARIMGSGLVAVAVLMFASTALVAATGWPADLLVVGARGFGVVGVFGLGGSLGARAYVVRFEADGYRVGLVRGAGVRHARWTEVTESWAASPAGGPLPRAATPRRRFHRAARSRRWPSTGTSSSTS